ncbi:hypothetical protein GGF37_007406, partial [Kickxella alabastrina]
VVEAKFPIVTKSTPEVIESVQNTAKSAESKFPIVARTFAVANSTLDRVDYVIDYVLPPSGTGSFAAAAAAATAGDEQPTTSANEKNMGKCEDQGGAKAEQEQEERQPPDSPSTGNVDSTIAKVTIIVRKLPRRLGRLFYNQLESSKAIISGVNQTVHDTAHVYGSEISERSYKMLESVQDHIKVVANDTIPSILPQVAQPYYEHSKDMLTTKVVKLHAEYSRTDRSLPTKVLNLMIIGGENLPVIGTVVSHLSRRAEKKYPGTISISKNSSGEGSGGGGESSGGDGDKADDSGKANDDEFKADDNVQADGDKDQADDEAVNDAKDERSDSSS